MNDLFVENKILQKVRDYPLIIACKLIILHIKMRKRIKRIKEWLLNLGRTLKILPTKFKYNIAIDKLNVCETSTYKPPLIHS